MDYKKFKEHYENKVPNKSFCPAPFLHTHINVNNRGFKLCCMSHVIGRLDKLSQTQLETELDNWWTSETMQEIRKSFLNGKMPSACDWWCGMWEKEEVKSNSDRLSFIRKYDDEFGHIDFDWDIKYGTKEYKRPVDIDLRPSKLCNLKCRSCNSNWSNKIEKEVLENPEIQGWTHWDNVTRSEISRKRAERIDWEDPNYDIISSLDMKNVRWLKISGGETLLDPNIFKIFTKLVENDYAKDLKLHIITNGTVFSDDLKSILKHFKHVRFNLSIDSIGEDEEFLRHGTIWSKKIKIINDLFEVGDVGILCTMQPIVLMKIQKITEFFLKFKKYGEKFRGVMYNSMVEPWFLHSGWLDKKDKDLILDQIEHTIFVNQMSERDQMWFDTVYKELSYDFGDLNSRYANDFVRAQKALDKIRGTDTLKIAPFLKKYYDRYDPNNLTEEGKRPSAQFKDGKPYA